MKISTRDKKILLMFLGVLFLVLSYFFVYKPQLEEAQNIEAENIPLQTRLDELLEMAKNKEFYVQETQEMQSKILEYCSVFPADIRPEDGIVLVQNMESDMDMQISNVGLGQREFISSLDGSTEGDQGDYVDETLMEQANESTQEQINEIEGVEETPEVSGQSDVSNGIDMISALFSPTLYRTQDTIQFVSTYDSLKKAVKYLAAQSGRMTLNNVNASFDTTTGNLTGTMTVNLFSMTGAGTDYNEPNAGKVPYGTDNIFGTIETKKKKAKNKKASDSADTSQKEQSQPEDAADNEQASQENGEAQQ